MQSGGGDRGEKERASLDAIQEQFMLNLKLPSGLSQLSQHKRAGAGGGPEGTSVLACPVRRTVWQCTAC